MRESQRQNCNILRLKLKYDEMFILCHSSFAQSLQLVFVWFLFGYLKSFSVRFPVDILLCCCDETLLCIGTVHTLWEALDGLKSALCAQLWWPFSICTITSCLYKLSEADPVQRQVHLLSTSEPHLLISLKSIFCFLNLTFILVVCWTQVQIYFN